MYMKTVDKIRKTTIVLLSVLCSVMSSCDFLDVVPEEQATLNDATRNPDAVLGFMYSCYAGVRSPLQYNMSEFSADECVFPPLWNNYGQQVSYGLYTPESVKDYRWNQFFASIAQTHLFLRELVNAKGCTEEDIEEWKAEAYFLLAYYHFELLRYFGPIPIIDQYIDQSMSIDDFPGRMHYDYVTDWIVKLLDEKVINNDYLCDMRPDEEFGRATRIAAKALKARTLLYAASPLWNGSFTYSNWKNKVETPGYGYELVSKTYDRNKWVRAQQACSEALQAALDAGYKLYNDLEFYKSNGLKENELPDIPGLAEPNSEEGLTFRKRVFLMRYAVTLEYASGNNEYIWVAMKNDDLYMTATLPNRVIQNNNGNWFSGYSGVAPTLYSVEHFYTQNGLLPKEDENFPDDSEWLKSAGIKGNTDVIKLNTLREPRFYAWFAFDGGEYGYKFANGKPLIIDFKDSQAQGYNPALFNRNCDVTGYLAQKYVRPNVRRTKANAWNVQIANKFYRPIIRLAYLYLMLAECCAELEDKEGVYNNLNPVRERAGVEKLTDELCAKSSMSLRDWVRNERFVELWGEGQRYFDLRRWVIADDYLGEGKNEGLNAIEKLDPSFEEFNKRVLVNQPFRWNKRMYLMPIDYNEIIKNPQLVQAPGY